MLRFCADTTSSGNKFHKSDIPFMIKLYLGSKFLPTLWQHLVLNQTDQSDQKNNNALYMVIYLIRLICLSQN
jgi:hypothetical protein